MTHEELQRELKEESRVRELIMAKSVEYQKDRAIYKALWTEIQTVVNGESKTVWIPVLTEKPDDLICAEKAN